MKNEERHKTTNLYILHSIVLILLVSGNAFAQQKTQYTQYMFDGLVLNPAYAGVDEALSVTFISRNQWTGLEGSPKTQRLSGHTLFKKNNVGIGFAIHRDEIGVHRNLNVLTNYAYHLRVSEESVLSFGLQAGIYNRRSDYLSLLEGSGNDPLLFDGLISNTSFDFGAGLYYRASKLHIGYSIPEFIPEKISFNDTTAVKLNELNHFLFSKYRININENIDLEPSVLFKYMHHIPLSFDMNVNVIYRQVLTTGISYRRSESVDFLLKVQATPQFQFGYAYDYPIKQVAELANASHEIMLHYLFRFRQEKVASPR